MESNGRIVQELVNFVREQKEFNREQKELNRDQKAINHRLEKLIKAHSGDLQELREMNRGIVRTLAYSEKRFQTFYQLIVNLQRRG